jgi:hypothetical protein
MLMFDTALLTLSLIAQAASPSPVIALRAGLSVLPTNLVASRQNVRLDGVRPGGAPLEQTRQVEAARFGPALALGLTVEPLPWLTTSLQIDALLASFASNEGKNGQVYGARLALGAGAHLWRRGPLALSAGVSGAVRFGGYGVTSFDRAGQPSVTVGDSTFYDDDIGVHVVDVAWQLGPTLSASYALSSRWRLALSVAHLWTLSQRSSINVAGEVEDGTVAWERVELDAPSFVWTSQGRRVVGPDTLPYTLSGPSLALLVLYTF